MSTSLTSVLFGLVFASVWIAGLIKGKMLKMGMAGPPSKYWVFRDAEPVRFWILAVPEGAAPMAFVVSSIVFWSRRS